MPKRTTAKRKNDVLKSQLLTFLNLVCSLTILKKSIYLTRIYLIFSIFYSLVLNNLTRYSSVKTIVLFTK